MSDVRRVLIIAEAGVNHNGCLEMAKQLVDVAVEAGADIVKFQTFTAEKIATESAAKAEYQARKADEAGNDLENQLAMLRRLELSRSDHEELILHCHKRGIGFFSTAFDLDSLDYLRTLGFLRFKIPSGEITNLPYLRKVAGFGCEVILSTGMSTMEELGAAIEVLQRGGVSRDRLTVLHCTSSYPTPISEVNLRAMRAISETFGVAIGYSDHTEGIEVSIAAVALGAQVIEKHFTLDRTLPGPDHKASLEPDELRAMVASIRRIELALGSAEKAPSISEAPNMKVARKSIVACRQISSGEKFSEYNLAAKRPGHGISPMHWDTVIGRVAPRDFDIDEMIEL